MTSVKEKKLRLMSEEEANVLSLDRPKIVPKPIVGDEFSDTIFLTDAFVGILKDKKNTATAIKSLTLILPLFGYLKRCSGNKLLLAFLNDNKNVEKTSSFATQNELKNFLNYHKFDLNLFKDDFLIVSVPKNAPITKIQAKKASQYWPINFHPNLQIEKLLNGDFFNLTQLKIIEACMKVCIEAAKKESIGNIDCDGSTVILNPNDNGVGRIIAVASTRINEHPLWHSAMLAIDLVAKMRGRGAWNLNSENNSNNLSASIDGHKRKLNCLKPFCYPESLNSINFPTFSQAIEPLIKSNGNDDTDNDSSYLCTNYWVFLLQEPCPLCAMALLHSRVSMIFYGCSNQTRGVLGSKSLLHTLAGLNHRYKVWSSVLEDDCMRTALEISQRSNKTVQANS